MKTLSIIGIILSSLFVLMSIAAMTNGHNSDSKSFGFILSIISLYLLAFSIVALVKTNKK